MYTRSPPLHVPPTADDGRDPMDVAIDEAAAIAFQTVPIAVSSWRLGDDERREWCVLFHDGRQWVIKIRAQSRLELLTVLRTWAEAAPLRVVGA
jgi:hypothetical protein